MSKVNDQGYRFRSGLVARWAVFFTHLNFPFLYELEGFELSNKVRYLPDFYLPQGVLFDKSDAPVENVWLDIRPSVDLDDDELNKLIRFVKETSFHLLLIAGAPGPEAIMRFIAYAQLTCSAPFVKWVEVAENQLGLIQANDADADEWPAVQQRLRTAGLAGAYAAAAEAGFDEREMTPAANGMKSCAGCGRFFHPTQPHHRFCLDCFKQANPFGRSLTIESYFPYLMPAASEEREVVEAEQIRCQGCGRTFTPLQPEYKFCAVCYQGLHRPAGSIPSYAHRPLLSRQTARPPLSSRERFMVYCYFAVVEIVVLAFLLFR